MSRDTTIPPFLGLPPIHTVSQAASRYLAPLRAICWHLP